MSTTFIRSLVVAATLLGAISAASAAPYYNPAPSADSGSFHSGVIDNFNKFTHKLD